MKIFKKFFPAVSILGALALPASSSAAFLDNFEDGNVVGWTAATNGGSSQDGVQMHNGSLMAYVAHTATGSPSGSATNMNSLAQDFTYLASDLLSFDMHAISTTASTCCTSTVHGKAGVTITFLNAFNISLGSAGLYYTTSPALLGTNESLIDSVQHNYSATMASFASLAGLGPTAPIAKISLTFGALGQFVGGGNIYPNASATATVWFDNVAVGVVPEPESCVLMLFGLVALSMLRRSCAPAPLRSFPGTADLTAVEGRRRPLTAPAGCWLP